VTPPLRDWAPIEQRGADRGDVSHVVRHWPIYLEHDARVTSFVKNDHLDFMIPHVFEGVGGRWGFVEVSDLTTFQRVMDQAIADIYADGVTTGGADL